MKKCYYNSLSKLIASIFIVSLISCSKDSKDSITEPVLVIRKIFPTCGIIGSAVTIYGDQFIPTVPFDSGIGPHKNTSLVTFNGIVVEAGSVYQDSVGKQRIIIIVPQGATSGRISITANGTTVTSSEEFKIDSKCQPDPVITYISPVCGLIGSTVTIYGDQFIPTVPAEKGRGPHKNTSVVTFNGIVVEASRVYQDSGQQLIRINVPQGATSGRITITANGTTVSSPEEFTITIPSYIPNVDVTSIRTYGTKLAIDAEENLYIARTETRDIVKISPDGKFNILWSSTNGDIPYGIAVDSGGNVYASIIGSYILKINKDGKANVFAGSNEQGYLDGTGINAKFNLPFDITLDKEGNILVADSNNSKIRKITPNGVVTTLAGSTCGYLDGLANKAQFQYPGNITLDAEENVYVSEGDRIRKITKDGQVTTVVRSDHCYKDGTKADAKFLSFDEIEFDSKGNLYLTHQFVVRRITPDGVVQTVAGSNPGQIDGPGPIAQFYVITGIAKNKKDVFYIAEQAGGFIRKIVIN